MASRFPTITTVEQINNPAIREQFSDRMLLAFIEGYRNTIAIFKGGMLKAHAIKQLPEMMRAAQLRGLTVPNC